MTDAPRIFARVSVLGGCSGTAVRRNLVKPEVFRAPSIGRWNGYVKCFITIKRYVAQHGSDNDTEAGQWERWVHPAGGDDRHDDSGDCVGFRSHGVIPMRALSYGHSPHCARL